jgi:hypothetical protein
MDNQSYGAPPRLPATRGVYEIAAPEGSLNASLTITEVSGANEDPAGRASTYRLPIGAKHTVAADLFARLTAAGRSSKMGSAQEFGKVGNWRGLERFTFLGLFASWPILRNDALR